MENIIEEQEKYENSIVFHKCSQEFIEMFKNYLFVTSSIINENYAIILNYDKRTFGFPEMMFQHILRRTILSSKNIEINCFSCINEVYYIIHKNVFVAVKSDNNYSITIFLEMINKHVTFPPLKENNKKNIYQLVVTYIDQLLSNENIDLFNYVP